MVDEVQAAVATQEDCQHVPARQTHLEHKLTRARHCAEVRHENNVVQRRVMGQGKTTNLEEMARVLALYVSLEERVEGSDKDHNGS